MSSAPSLRPCIQEGNELAAAVTAALRAECRGADGRGTARDSRPRGRRGARTAPHSTAGLPTSCALGGRRSEVLEGIDVDHTLRVIAYLTIVLSTNAVIAAGGRPDDGVSLPAGTPRHEGARGVAAAHRSDAAHPP